MKRILMIFATLLLVCSTATAQDTATVYRSVFGDSITEWYLCAAVEYYDAAEVWTTHWLINNDDTVRIDDNLYTRAIRIRTANIPLSHLSLYDTIYVRESERKDKLYARYFPSDGFNTLTPEILVMDMDLAIGDTLSSTNWNSLIPVTFGATDYYYSYPTIKVDSVYYVDGIKHIITDYYVAFGNFASVDQSYIDTLRFIEGIGPTLGIHYPTWPNSVKTGLVCSFKDTTRVYHTQEATDSCNLYVIYGNIKSVSGTSVKFWPNPVADRMTLSGLPDGGVTMTIFDTDGRPVIVTKPNVVGGSCEIDVESLRPGIYFLTVGDGRSLRTHKFIKL